MNTRSRKDKTNDQFEDDMEVTEIPKTKVQKTEEKDMTEEEIEMMEQASLQVAAQTLTGDIRDFILEEIKHHHHERPWDQRPEQDQRDLVDRIESAVTLFTKQCVETIEAGGRTIIDGEIKQLTIKDGIKTLIHVSERHPYRHELMDSNNSRVMIVLSKFRQYEGQKAPVRITKDQADIEEVLSEEGLENQDDEHMERVDA